MDKSSRFGALGKPAIGIMQPYFFPYRGYFSLLETSDQFVIYDKIKFTKRGFINRNYVLSDHQPKPITVSLRKASDSAQISEREVSAEYSPERLVRIVLGAYRNAVYKSDLEELMERFLKLEPSDLFTYLFESLEVTKEFLGLTTPIVRSSQVELEPCLRGQDRVISICSALNASTYINPLGGIDMYSPERFEREGIRLASVDVIPKRENRRWNGASGTVTYLSILDDIATRGREETRRSVMQDFRVRLHDA